MKKLIIAILLFVQFIFANSLSLVDNNDGTWNVNYSSDKEIREFSFSVEGATINNLSHRANIWINVNGSVVTGLSARRKSIPKGQGVLLILHLSSAPTSLSNIEITDSQRETHAFNDSSQHLLHIQTEDPGAQVPELRSITSKLKSDTDYSQLEEAIDDLIYKHHYNAGKIFALQVRIDHLESSIFTDDNKKELPQKASPKKVNNIPDVDCQYDKYENDAFNGDKIIWTEVMEIGENKLGDKVTFQFRSIESKDAMLIVLAFDHFGDLGCMSHQRSKAILKFSDGELVTFIHVGDTECKNGAEFSTMIYGSDEQSNYISREDYEKLKTMKIEMIRIHGTEYYTDITIDEDKQDILLKYITCVE